MPYRLLLADADGTLFNFREGERNAIANTFERFGVPVTDEYTAVYHRINAMHWARLERGETTQAALRVDRFRDFLRETGLPGDSQRMCDVFVEQLGKQRIVLPGAKALCECVSACMPIILVTNGIAKVQRSRFADCELSPYLSGIVISEEVGHAKPHPAMVEEALRMAGLDNRREAVLLGDSVTADIAAANNAGVDSILFTDGAEPPRGNGATFTARTLEDARRIICGLSPALPARHTL